MPETFPSEQRRDAESREVNAMTLGLLHRAGYRPMERLPAGQRDQELVQRADWYESIEDVARQCARMEHVADPTGGGDTIRAAVTTASWASVMENLAEVVVIDTLASEDDTVTPWTQPVDVLDFKRHKLAHVFSGEPLKLRPRNQRAASSHFDEDVEESAVQLEDYARWDLFDRQDFIGSDRVGAITSAIADLVRGAEQVRKDLVFAELLRNPTMRDGNPLFDSANHGNEDSNQLDSTALATGLQRIRSQRIRGHSAGLRPAALLIPPELEGSAREALRALTLGDDVPVSLVVEDRLSNGVTDPRDGTEHAGSDSNWYLSTDGTRGVVRARLEGTNGLVQRSTWVKAGEGGYWGTGFAFNLTADAAVTDWRGLYRSSP